MPSFLKLFIKIQFLNILFANPFLLLFLFRFRRNTLVSALSVFFRGDDFFKAGIVYRIKRQRGCAAEMSLLKQYLPLKKLIIIYQSVIIHIMSEQKVGDSIFIKNVYETDYVLEF